MPTETEAVENRGVVGAVVVRVAMMMMMVVVDLWIEIESVHADAKRATAWPTVDRWVGHQHKTGDLKCRRH